MKSSPPFAEIASPPLFISQSGTGAGAGVGGVGTGTGVGGVGTGTGVGGVGGGVKEIVGGGHAPSDFAAPPHSHSVDTFGGACEECFAT